MMTFKRLRFGLIATTLMLLGLLVLAACGGDRAGGDSDDDSGMRSSSVDEPQAVAPGEGMLAAEADQSAEDSDVEAPRFDASYVANQIPLDQKVIRTATISLTVEDVAQGNVWIRDLAARSNGFVFSSNTYIRNGNEFAQITIRVPSSEFDAAIRELREHNLVVQVDSEESTSQDVSQEYVDNESRLRSLEVTQNRFIELLSEADSIADILRIESELSSVRSQIESIKGRQNYLDQMTAYSTITVSLHVDGDDVDPASDEESFFARIFNDSWDRASGAIEAILGLAMTLAFVGLAFLPFAIVLYLLGRFTYRRFSGAKPEAPVSASAAEGSAE